MVRGTQTENLVDELDLPFYPQFLGFRLSLKGQDNLRAHDQSKQIPELFIVADEVVIEFFSVADGVEEAFA